METEKIKRIYLNQVSKTFKIGYKNTDGFLSNVLSLISGKESKKIIKVIDDISFEAYAGENIGIIGKNGSGKSTLLRLIANIYKHTVGDIITTGELVYIDGYGLGLQQKLSMKNNIYLVGVLMGLKRAEINKRFNDIVSFAELEEFVHTKLYQFSSGMLNRLSFSITIHCLEHKNPKILLLDEVFGGSGDLSFQNKATAKMENFITGGATVVLVSHDLSLIKQYCNRVILLDKGKKIQEGEPDVVIEKYKTL